MKVLITGAAGMVGFHSAEYYSKRASKIIAIDNLMRSKLMGKRVKSVEYNWELLKRKKNVSCILGDIRDEKFLKKIFQQKFNLVIHTAGQPGVMFSLKNPKDDFYINGIGTFNLLEFIRKYCPSATFIFCSTNKVYGQNLSKFKLKELKTRYIFKDIKGIDEKVGIDLTPHTPYGVSKYVADIYTQEYGYSYGIKTAVFRMSCIYGKRQFGFEDQGWLSWITIAFLKGKQITIYGNGKQVRDILWVDDLIKAFDLFHNSDLHSEVFNIGGGPNNTISILELLDFLQNFSGKKPKIRFADWRPSDQKVYISDISKLRRKLNWKPQVSKEEGLKKLFIWVKKNLNLF